MTQEDRASLATMGGLFAAMKPSIRTTRHYSDEWTAIDDDTYDGPGSPIGSGSTEAEAVADLAEKMALPEREEV